MDKENEIIFNEIKNRIYTIRDIKVMLDEDLARLYMVETKQLNRAVKRNIERFPEDFCFKLTEDEHEILRCQFGTSSGHGGKRYLSYAFTEQGISMLSGVLSSKKAILINVEIMRAFVFMRNTLLGNEEIFIRLNILERKSLETEDKFDKIFTLLKNPDKKRNQGIFYEGQIFDSYLFISDLIKSAKHNILLIDNYVDESTLMLFNKRKKNVQVTIYTKITPNLKIDIEKYNLQYPIIELKEFNLSHDRFLIIDNIQIYHIGASLKDIGKKWFAFSKLDKENLNILERLK